MWMRTQAPLNLAHHASFNPHYSPIQLYSLSTMPMNSLPTGKANCFEPLQDKNDSVGSSINHQCSNNPIQAAVPSKAVAQNTGGNDENHTGTKRKSSQQEPPALNPPPPNTLKSTQTWKWITPPEYTNDVGATSPLLLALQSVAASIHAPKASQPSAPQAPQDDIEETHQAIIDEVMENTHGRHWHSLLGIRKSSI
ncbi:hypothetical protein BDQ17DRAFT_1327272 [Cyathus striatus]|nr:hypothetical protein BDQ17DRAFT_1327272 [Cyathus striatus]